jgi:hypothetical protein
MKGLMVAACLGVLAACEQVKTPHVFGTTEVPPDVLNEPRTVTSPSPEEMDKTWPRLGDVPSNPHNFTSQKDIDTTKQQMIDDRTQAEALRKQADFPSPDAQ